MLNILLLQDPGYRGTDGMGSMAVQCPSKIGCRANAQYFPRCLFAKVPSGRILEAMKNENLECLKLTEDRKVSANGIDAAG